MFRLVPYKGSHALTSADVSASSVSPPCLILSASATVTCTEATPDSTPAAQGSVPLWVLPLPGIPHHFLPGFCPDASHSFFKSQLTNIPLVDTRACPQSFHHTRCIRPSDGFILSSLSSLPLPCKLLEVLFNVLLLLPVQCHISRRCTEKALGLELRTRVPCIISVT